MAVGRNVMVVLALMGSAGSALAQPASPADAPTTDVSRQSGTLSDKLGTTDGVIHPQGGIDAGIQKAPSVESRMPVIPPTGSAGAGHDGVAK